MGEASQVGNAWHCLDLAKTDREKTNSTDY